ncbi:MAG: c-type cytochrome [Pseudomonadota bacterium]
MLRLTICLLIALWPAMAGAQTFFTLKGHGGPIKGVAAGYGMVLTASFDNSVGLWREGAPFWLEGHEAAVNTIALISPTEAITGGDDFAVIRWDLILGTPTIMGRHKGKVMALAHHDGLTASASWDGSVGLWSDGEPVFLKGHGGAVNTVAFSADGHTLYSGSADGEILVWDVASARQDRRLLNAGFGVNTLVLNEAEGWLAYGAVDGVTRVVDLDTGETLQDFSLERRPILAMALSADGTTLATGDGHGYISLIDVRAGHYIADLRATLRGPVWALAFSENGENIHAGGLDAAMYSWPLSDLRSGEQMVQGETPFLRGAETQSNGQRQFDRKCSICHTLTVDSGRRAGPSLMNVFGRRAGSVAQYNYSETLLTSDIVWSDDTIDALFDQGPDVYTPGSKMPMQRITDPADRADLIAYLREFSRGEE